MINGTKQFPEYANEIINGISWLYLAENETMTEPQDIKTSAKIPKTLKIHKVLRTFNENNVCKMEFYELVDETDTFKTCCCCKERYKGNEEWLECKLCDQ